MRATSAVTRSWFHVVMGGVALAAVLLGFGYTYMLPMARGSFRAPFAVHLHGALALSWVLLFLAQPILVRLRRVTWHRRIGVAAVPLAVAVVITMIPASAFQVQRELRDGLGDAAYSGMLGVLTSGAVFVALVTAGYLTRRNREAHARWMLLATLVVIWPAWFRFRHWLPGVPRPEIWLALVLADVWIIVAMLRDRFTRGAVHPVLLWGGSAVILEQTTEVLLFDSPLWRTVAHSVWSVIGS